MATKYDRVDPHEEKLKRLYNCSRMTPDDQKYLNYTFERYKLRNFHIISLCLGGVFAGGSIPFVKQASPFKYWTSLSLTCVALYKLLTGRNNQHFEQIVTPYFEKYRVK